MAEKEGSLEWFVQREKARLRGDSLPLNKTVPAETNPLVKENSPSNVITETTPSNTKVSIKSEKGKARAKSSDLDLSTRPCPPERPILDSGTLYAMKRKTCEELIKILFFSNTRTIIFFKKQRKLHSDMHGSLKSYYQNQIQSGLPVNFSHALTHILNIWMASVYVTDGSERVVRRTPQLKRDEAFIQEASAVIMKQFHVILNISPWGQNPENKNRICAKFENFALAVLSFMKRTDKKLEFHVGNEVYDYVIIPRLPYAAKYAPPTTDFSYYGFKKNLITDGTNIITDAYKSFKGAGVKFPIELFM